MAGRNRSKGIRSGKWVYQKYDSLQAQRIYTGGKYVIQYRTVPVTNAYWVYTDDRETMADFTSLRSMYKYVDHRKRIDYPFIDEPKGASVQQSLYTGGTYAWTEYGIANNRITGLGGFSFQSQTGVDGSLFPYYTNPVIDWTQLVSQVGLRLDGSMKTGQNLVVSIAELSKTVGMIKNPGNLKNLSRLYRKKGPLGTILKSVSGAYLELEYGWKNLWRDYIAIANVWQEVRQHRSYLKETQDTFQSLSASEKYVKSNPTQSLAYVGNAYSPSLKLQPKITSVETTGTFSLDVRRTEQQRIWSTFDLVVQRLGGKDLASALWDLVPFSFVVDWFTHINRFMEQAPITWHSYDLRYIGYSLKTDWFARLDVTSQACVTPVGRPQLCKSNNYSLGPMCIQTLYARYPGFPSGTTSVGLFGSLNKSQIASGIALIVQRM